MRISDWSSDVCSSDLAQEGARADFAMLTERRSFTAEWRVARDDTGEALMLHARHAALAIMGPPHRQRPEPSALGMAEQMILACGRPCLLLPDAWPGDRLPRSEEHTSELQSLMRTS